MTNKAKLKKTITKDFDKNINYNIIINKMKRGYQMNKIFKYATIPICLIAIICISLLLNQNQPDIQEKDKIIYFNQVDETSQTSLDADIKTIAIQELPSKFSFINNIVVPKSFPLNNSYAVYTKGNASSNYNVLHDYVFEYHRNDMDKILISFSELEHPLRDYYFDEENPKQSEIGHTELVIYQFKENYIAQFTYNDIYFDIETTGISQNELIDLLSSIIK